jgi:hypothetical protein
MIEVLKYFLEVGKALLPFKSWFYKQFAGVSISNPSNLAHVPGPHFQVQGRYRWIFGRTIVLFHVTNHDYYPQGDAVLDPTNKRWHANVSVDEVPHQNYTIVVAAVTREFRLITNYYLRVHQLLLQRNPPINTWLSFQMLPDNIPTDFLELDRITITHP